MKEITLSLVKKDTKTYTIRLTENGVAVPINNWYLYFTAKNDWNDLDSAAIISKSLLMPDNSTSTAGIGYLPLTSTDTDKTIGEFFFDIKLVNPGITRTTFARGKLLIMPTGRLA